ncbi:helix-turn-helix domain-containing protein [Amycolatopsis sp. NPDC054798]
MTDAKAMRALAHPLRLELLEHLALAGTLTAAQASELVGETPANCSFHLRTLAKYGFVQQAEGGRGRERPWRLIPGGIGTTEVRDDTETSANAQTLTDVIVNRHLETIRTYRASVQPSLPPEWQQLSGHISMITHLTVDEMRQLRTDILALLTQFADRGVRPSRRPPGSRPVQLFAFTMPRPPTSASGAAPDHDDSTRA